MDPILVQAGVDLGVVMATNTVSSIRDRIRTARAESNKDRTIEDLQAIINDLVNDKLELQRIADVYREAVAAQTLTDEDLQLIARKVPELAETFGVAAEVEPIAKLLDADVLRIAQALGFNFKAALGQPLTQAAAQQIEARLAPQKRPTQPNKRQGK